MKVLSQSEDINIRNKLDEMEARLYYNALLFEDAYWAHRTIKQLLFKIYMLQIGMKEREADGGDVAEQYTVADISDK